MQDKPNNRPFSLALILGAAVAVLAAGGGTAWWTMNALKLSPKATPNVSPTPTDITAQEKGLKIYWLSATGDDIKLEPSVVKIQDTGDKRRDLEVAFENLLAGPNNANYATTIPQNTKLLDLAIEDDGVHLNLSQEFTEGGGSASMTGRLAQVLYTASSLAPNTPVWIEVEGKPLDVLGGEGLIVDQPMTRQDFEENFGSMGN
jgi:spore germination protein GerM